MPVTMSQSGVNATCAALFEALNAMMPPPSRYVFKVQHKDGWVGVTIVPTARAADFNNSLAIDPSVESVTISAEG